MSADIKPLYERTIDLTVSNVNSGTYLHPERIVLDVAKELSQLLELKLITQEEHDQWRYRLFNSIYGS